MDIIKKSFNELFPDRLFNYSANLKYSKAFSDYNANVKYTKDRLEFKLSDKWKGVSEEIVIGLIQSLLLKIFKERKKTTNIDLYNMFLKNIHIGVVKNKIEPALKESFRRINEEYFAGMLDIPNLVFGNYNLSKLGSYEYGSDTITISKVLEDENNLLDYVMYHEMLHKKLKFSHKTTRSIHHSKEFRKKEKMWHDSDVEKKLKIYLHKKRRKNLFGF